MTLERDTAYRHWQGGPSHCEGKSSLSSSTVLAAGASGGPDQPKGFGQSHVVHTEVQFATTLFF